jgi:hypothetical protein
MLGEFLFIRQQGWHAVERSAEGWRVEGECGQGRNRKSSTALIEFCIDSGRAGSPRPPAGTMQF